MMTEEGQDKLHMNVEKKKQRKKIKIREKYK